MFLQLPSEIHTREIARLAPLFSPNTLETVALRFFGISMVQIGNLLIENPYNPEGFKRKLLQIFLYKENKTRKVITEKASHKSISFSKDKKMLSLCSPLLSVHEL